MLSKSCEPSLPTRRPKALLVANTGWYLHQFRRALADRLTAEGWETVLVAPRDEYWERLSRDGYRCLDLPLARGKFAGWRELRCFRAFRQILELEQPDLVHYFTLKCVFLGALHAPGARYGSVFAFTGLGHLFIDRSLRSRLARHLWLALMRPLLRRARYQAIFQNEDDRRVFLEGRLIPAERARVIPGSGIDLQHFRRATASPRGDPPLVLMIARLLREKGVRELVAAGRELAAARPVRFAILGAPDPGNPSSIPAEEIEAWRALPWLELPGHVADVRPWLERARVLALPSYREGSSKTLLEAAAMEVPVVASDVPGCNNLVHHGRTGLLVPARDAASLARAIGELLDRPDWAARLGREARARAEREFSNDQVLRATLATYSALS